MKTLAVRLEPDQELISEIKKIIRKYEIKAGYILTCVGSLKSISCRMAGAKPEKQDVRDYEGAFEIVSLVGTLSPYGNHIHVSFSDKEGKVVGGHLKNAIIETTVEIVIGTDEAQRFGREIDKTTGFKELIVDQ